MDYLQYEDYLQHHGIKGMKWGVRRYRNKDDSLTAAGKKRYDYYDEKGPGGKKGASTVSNNTKPSNVKVIATKSKRFKDGSTEEYSYFKSDKFRNTIANINRSAHENATKKFREEVGKLHKEYEPRVNEIRRKIPQVNSSKEFQKHKETIVKYGAELDSLQREITKKELALRKKYVASNEVTQHNINVEIAKALGYTDLEKGASIVDGYRDRLQSEYD